MKDSNKKGITAKELADLTEETYYTIDYWTKMNLLKPNIIGRTRYYNKGESLIRCKKIRELQNQKMHIELIEKELDKIYN